MWSAVGQEVESFYMPLGMMNLQEWRWEEQRTQKTDWGEREKDTAREKEKAGQSQHPRGASKQKLEAEMQKQPTASSSHW